MTTASVDSASFHSVWRELASDRIRKKDDMSLEEVKNYQWVVSCWEGNNNSEDDSS